MYRQRRDRGPGTFSSRRRRIPSLRRGRRYHSQRHFGSRQPGPRALQFRGHAQKPEHRLQWRFRLGDGNDGRRMRVVGGVSGELDHRHLCQRKHRRGNGHHQCCRPDRRDAPDRIDHGRGQTVTVSQAARNCSYSINPSAADFPSAGGTGSVTVTAPTGCAWTATTNAAWIGATSGASGSGAGSVVYSVGANAGAPRTGTLLIAGQIFTVNQTSPPCSFGIGPTSQNVSRAAGTGATVAVTTPSFCSWAAVSNASWITVSPPTTGLGNGNVSWTYTVNQAPAQRTGTMTIAGQTFTVTQEAGCAYAISPTSQTVSRNSGTGTTVAITTQAACAWTAASNASWITVGAPTSGTGNGSVGWTYAANTTPAQRTGTMTIAGQTFTVTQDPGCSYAINPTNQSVRDAAGTGTTVAVTTQSRAVGQLSATLHGLPSIRPLGLGMAASAGPTQQIRGPREAAR